MLVVRSKEGGGGESGQGRKEIVSYLNSFGNLQSGYINQARFWVQDNPKVLLIFDPVFLIFSAALCANTQLFQGNSQLELNF